MCEMLGTVYFHVVSNANCKCLVAYCRDSCFRARRCRWVSTFVLLDLYAHQTSLSLTLFAGPVAVNVAL